MWQVVKVGPALGARDQGERGGPWQDLRGLWVNAAKYLVQLAPRVERVKARGQDQPVAVDARPRYDPRGGAGLRVVEAVVLAAVAVYFVAGVVGVFVA